MVDLPLASDLSYEVLQRRAGRGELAAPSLDSSNQRLVLVPGYVEREAFIADPAALSEDTLIPTWHVHRRKR